jgi:hypothetical protein
MFFFSIRNGEKCERIIYFCSLSRHWRRRKKYFFFLLKVEFILFLYMSREFVDSLTRSQIARQRKTLCFSCMFFIILTQQKGNFMKWMHSFKIGDKLLLIIRIFVVTDRHTKYKKTHIKVKIQTIHNFLNNFCLFSEFFIVAKKFSCAYISHRFRQREKWNERKIYRISNCEDSSNSIRRRNFLH